MTGPLAHREDAFLVPDAARVVARLFLPGEEFPVSRSRAGSIIDHVMRLDEQEVERIAAQVVAAFSGRHPGYDAILERHASIVERHVAQGPPLSAARRQVIGATFTAEYALEGAALCNPSAVLHPDQSGLLPGQARMAVSLRAIGEGHVSSIVFCTAVVGPGASWSFDPRELPVVAGNSAPTPWAVGHLRAVLADHGRIDELAGVVLGMLPDPVDVAALEVTLADVPVDLLIRGTATATVDLLRRLVASSYEVSFEGSPSLSQRVLVPSAPEESNGMEDARLTRFTRDDGTVEFRGTYTAYDGQKIAPRLLLSDDLETFRATRLAGSAARNKGIALFPRSVGGRHLALCRTDGQSISLASSADGFAWGDPELLHGPTEPWEFLQVGNCGPPIETGSGWLVLTHGVGPMRRYVMGALLLDLDDPSRVVARLTTPLIEPADGEQDGYVPNVVYSCGAALHDGRVWIPFGIDDVRIGVAWVDLAELLAAMTRS